MVKPVHIRQLVDGKPVEVETALFNKLRKAMRSKRTRELWKGKHEIVRASLHELADSMSKLKAAQDKTLTGTTHKVSWLGETWKVTIRDIGLSATSVEEKKKGEGGGRKGVTFLRVRRHGVLPGAAGTVKLNLISMDAKDRKRVFHKDESGVEEAGIGKAVLGLAIKGALKAGQKAVDAGKAGLHSGHSKAADKAGMDKNSVREAVKQLKAHQPQESQLEHIWKQIFHSKEIQAKLKVLEERIAKQFATKEHAASLPFTHDLPPVLATLAAFGQHDLFLDLKHLEPYEGAKSFAEETAFVQGEYDSTEMTTVPKSSTAKEGHTLLEVSIHDRQHGIKNAAAGLAIIREITKAGPSYCRGSTHVGTHSLGDHRLLLFKCPTVLSAQQLNALQAALGSATNDKLLGLSQKVLG
jgi:hypothetical protein